MDALFNDILSSAVHASAATQPLDSKSKVSVQEHLIKTLVKLLTDELVVIKCQNAELLAELKQLNATAEKSSKPAGSL